MQTQTHDNPTTPSPVVINAIHRRFGAEEAAEVIAKMYYSSMGCWCFNHYGMFWGVEADGYIHT